MPLREKLALLKELILPGLVAFSVLGSLYLGWATPTEAAGVGVVGAVIAAAWNRKLSWAGVRGAVIDTTKVTAMLYWLFFGSSALIGVYTLAGGTRLIQDAMTSLPVGPMGVILIMMLIWIVLGCFIDWIGILLLTAPIFVPVASKLGFDLVWLGVLFCMNMQISYISPPFGPAAFYLKGVVAAGHHAWATSSARSWPYLVLQLIALGLVIAVPADRALAAEHDGEVTAMERRLDRVVDVMRVPVTGDPAVAVMQRRGAARRSARSNATSSSSAAAWAASRRRWPRRGAAAAPACSRRPTGSAASSAPRASRRSTSTSTSRPSAAPPATTRCARRCATTTAGRGRGAAGSGPNSTPATAG